MAEGDDHTDDDPFAGWTLDDAFVASAAIPEASAEERVRRPEPLAPVPPRRGDRKSVV